MTDEAKLVQVHVQKVRKKANGKVGLCELVYDPITGQYRDEKPAWYPQAMPKRKEAA